jgi:hypothetical protein
VGTLHAIESEQQRRTSEDYIAAAVEMVDRYGSAYQGLGYTMVAAADAAGIGRKALYRRWESVTDLTADLARYGAMGRPGWGARALRSDPSLPLDRAVAEAAAERDLGPMIRAVASAWPMDHPARKDIAAWELTWFDACAEWLEQRITAMGRTFPEGSDAWLAAVTLTAWIDGMYFLAAWSTGPHLPGWGTRTGSGGLRSTWPQEVFPPAEVAAPEPAPPPERVAVPPSTGPELGDAKEAILDRLLAAALAPPASEASALRPGRAVDLARLARRLDVTERTLAARWPQPADLNGPVFDVMLDRVRRESEEHFQAALRLCIAERFTTYDQMMISGLGAMLDATLLRAPFTHFSMVTAMLDDSVRTASAAYTSEWMDSMATSFLAVFALSGWRLRDGITIKDLTYPLFATVLGLQRIGAMHPHLGEETRTFRGREVPALAFAAYRFVTGAITDEPYQAAEQARDAPPLTDDATRG